VMASAPNEGSSLSANWAATPAARNSQSTGVRGADPSG
jgi:hypothetical protein